METIKLPKVVDFIEFILLVKNVLERRTMMRAGSLTSMFLEIKTGITGNIIYLRTSSVIGSV